jgi:hypothetical protein
MSRTEEIGGQLLWFLGHALFTLITVCALRGGYVFYRELDSLRGIEFNLSKLEEAEKEVLAEQLVLDGFNIPKNIDEPKRRR